MVLQFFYSVLFKKNSAVPKNKKKLFTFYRYLFEILQKDSHIRKQDVFTVINTISQNPSGRHAAWYFYRHYYDDLVNM